MKKKTYTIFVLSDPSPSYKKFTLRRSTIIKTIAGLVLLSAAAVLVVYHSAQVSIQAARYQELTENVKQLKEENFHLSVATNRFFQKISNIESFQEQLSKIAGQDGYDASPRMPSGSGEEIFDYEMYDTDILNTLPLLEDKTARLEEKFQDLLDYYQKNTDLLASTPAIWPAKGYISSYFRYRFDPFSGKREFHPGIDIVSDFGSKVRCTADGVVRFAKRKGSYGKVVCVKHKFGYETRYGHLSKIVVKENQNVKRGDVIGYLGSTGKSTGPHLHYEVLYNNKNVNPLHYMIDEYRSNLTPS
jgi:murein DD-endopeptidase MepM/ murein hydrolase activator NlpD